MIYNCLVCDSDIYFNPTTHNNPIITSTTCPPISDDVTDYIIKVAHQDIINQGLQWIIVS